MTLTALATLESAGHPDLVGTRLLHDYLDAISAAEIAKFFARPSVESEPTFADIEADIFLETAAARVSATRAALAAHVAKVRAIGRDERGHHPSFDDSERARFYGALRSFTARGFTPPLCESLCEAFFGWRPSGLASHDERSAFLRWLDTPAGEEAYTAHAAEKLSEMAQQIDRPARICHSCGRKTKNERCSKCGARETA